MIEPITAVVDCRLDDRLDNNFLSLNLGGKPVYRHIIDTLAKSDKFKEIVILTNSDEICDNLHEDYKVVDDLASCIDTDILLVSGRAPFITLSTIEKAISHYKGDTLVSCTRARDIDWSEISFMGDKCDKLINGFMLFKVGEAGTVKINAISPDSLVYLDEKESIVINSKEDFELALILDRKAQNRAYVKRLIKNRIEEKKSIFSKANEHGICAIGHSQIDRWPADFVRGGSLRNCGISGISSFEYTDYILQTGLLTCSENLYLIMHGTNDIVYEKTYDEIAASIQKSIDYVLDKRADASIYFIECLHVNGRLDRSNNKIEKLNEYLYNHLKYVKWISMSRMDDKYGNLKAEYTIDGLHLSDEGYTVFQKIIEENIQKDLL